MTTCISIGMPCSSQEKAYQVIISRLDGLRTGELSYRKEQLELVDKGIGGFILFGGRRAELKSFIDELQDRSRIHLFIASDIERGVGQQVEGLTSFPSQMAVAAGFDLSQKADTELLVQAIRAVADEAADTGINMPLIPVLDVNRNPDNPIICTRAFSDDPDMVAQFASIYIKTLEGAGLISCAKHFPGHGDTSTDSHISLPEIRKTKNGLLDSDITPFRSAIKAGVGGIMIGHLSVPAFDARPASLSHRIITGLLKEELGFTGLVLTDALNMHALREFGDAGLECLKAGADILLHPDDPDAAASALLSALKEKRLDLGILDAAVKRILETKAGLIRRAPEEFDLNNHSLLSKTISQRAVTLIKDTTGLLPLADTKAVRTIFAGDDKYFRSSPFTSFRDPSLAGGNLNVTSDEVLLIVVFTSVAAWRGSSGISNEERNRLTELIAKAKKSIVVSFGSPYVLRYFREADVLIAAYDSTIQAQEAVINCLFGDHPFSGKLPVQIYEVSR
jgi:beta-N-acetylhexosaminidase